MQTIDFSKLPLGNSDFGYLRELNQIYVDKTDLICSLASLPRKFFLIRPRRFGKSLLVSTFESLFQNGLQEFHGLKIEKLWKDTRQYQVVRLDFSEISNFTSMRNFKEMFENHLSAQFSRIGFNPDRNSGISLLTQLSSWIKTCPMGSLVLLIDEYDSPLTSSLNNKKAFDFVRANLASFFSIIKSNDRCMRFFFMTGITKFSKTSIFSELNNLIDLSLMPEYGSLLGYTPEEVKKYFGEYLDYAASLTNRKSSELFTELCRQYDGFCFETSASQRVFSPWSLLNYFAYPRNGLQDYWFESGGRPSVLLQYMQSHYLRNPEEFAAKKSIRLDRLSAASNLETLSDIGLLTQAGYLTIKSVEGEVAILDYPNAEVRKAMGKLYLEQILAGKNTVEAKISSISEILSEKSPEKVFLTFNNLFKSVDYLNYPVKDEASLRTIIQVYLAGSGLFPHVEVHNYKGRSDLEVKVGNTLWVFEFKVVRGTEDEKEKLLNAINQVKNNDYGISLTNSEPIRMVLVFSLEKRQFLCWSLVGNE